MNMLAVISMHLISALIHTETRGVRDPDHAMGDYVHGRPTAFGCLQISQKVIDDVNRITGRRLTVTDAFHRPTAIWICQTYLNYWATKERLGREPTDQDRARIWNGGPDGWHEWATMRYWGKVHQRMASTDDGTWNYDFPKTVKMAMGK